MGVERTDHNPWQRCAGWRGPCCLAGCRRWWPRCRWGSGCSSLCSSSSSSNASRRIWATPWRKDLNVEKKNRYYQISRLDVLFILDFWTPGILFVNMFHNMLIIMEGDQAADDSESWVLAVFALTAKTSKIREIRKNRRWLISQRPACVFFSWFLLTHGSNPRGPGIAYVHKVDESTPWVHTEDGRPQIA